MKKNHTRVITLMLATILMFSGITGLLTGCQQPVVPTEDTTPSAQATKPVLQLPQEGKAMDDQTLEWFRVLFMAHQAPYTRHPTNWYNMILGTQFDCPENINLQELFYNGTLWPRTLSDSEKAYLQGRGFDLNFSVAVLPLEDANEVLESYFGLTWEQTKGVGTDAWTFSEDTQRFYKATTDYHSWNFEILGGAELDDGTIRLYYSLDFPGYEDTVFAITMQGKASQGQMGYYILSNLPVE